MKTILRNAVLCSLLHLLCSTAMCWSATYYVRPISGEYGSEDGSDYDNAFDGFADVDWGSVAASDTLFVAGTFSNRLVVGASGTGADKRLEIISCTIANGASTDDAGSIDGINLGASPSAALDINGYDYITVDGVTVQNNTGSHANGNFGVWVRDSAFIILKNMTIYNNRHNGVYASNGADNLIIEYCDIRYNGADTARAHGFLIEGSASPTVRYCFFEHNGDNDPSPPGSHNIYYNYDNTGTGKVYGNRIENAGAGDGVKLKMTGDVYNNYFEGNYSSGVLSIEYVGITMVQHVYNNVFVGNGIAGWMFWQEGVGTSTVYLYNNSFYQNDDDIVLGNSAIVNFYAKNNAVHTTTTDFSFKIYNIPTGTSVIENNWCYGNTGSNKYTWDGTGKTFAEWQALGNDSPIGDYADPKFTNPGNSNLTFQTDSPLIDAGEDLGDTYKSALHPDTTWTRQNPGIVQASVLTLDQDRYGSGWEVGAFVFYESETVSPPTPTGLRVLASDL